MAREAWLQSARVAHPVGVDGGEWARARRVASVLAERALYLHLAHDDEPSLVVHERLDQIGRGAGLTTATVRAWVNGLAVSGHVRVLRASSEIGVHLLRLTMPVESVGVAA